MIKLEQIDNIFEHFEINKICEIMFLNEQFHISRSGIRPDTLTIMKDVPNLTEFDTPEIAVCKQLPVASRISSSTIPTHTDIKTEMLQNKFNPIRVELKLETTESSGMYTRMDEYKYCHRGYQVYHHGYTIEAIECALYQAMAEYKLMTLHQSKLKRDYPI